MNRFNASRIRKTKSMSLSTLPLDERPYTTPDEDPFSAHSYLQVKQERRITRRRSSMLDKWIEEQQSQSAPLSTALEPLEAPTPFFAKSTLRSSSNPYLAYPDIPHAPSTLDLPAPNDDAISIKSYDMVEDDDIPSITAVREGGLSTEEPVTPNHRQSHKATRHSLTPSFRALNFSLRSSSPAGPSTPSSDMEGISRTFARLSLFPRTPRSSTGPISSSTSTTPQQQHNRSTSISSTLTQNSHQAIRLSSPSAKWRPSVLGHFHHQPSASQSSIAVSDAQSTPSRPSISSGETYTSSNATTTTLDSGIPTTPSKISLLDSIRFRTSRSSRTISPMAPVHQAADVKQEASNSDSGKGTLPRRGAFLPKSGSMLDNIDDEDDLDDPPTYRFNKAEARPPIPVTSSGSLSRKFSSIGSRSHRKRKKLIISGVGAAELRKLDGVRRWCESFGDMRSIHRMPNGDLLIDFKDPEVADTVCRVRAKVFIAGVGSVQLSWATGNKR